jgi:hypothetical protein
MPRATAPFIVRENDPEVPMGSVTTAALASVAYLLAVVFGIGLFLKTVGRALSDEGHVSQVEIAQTVGAAALLVFLIGGGYFWFRVVGVGM